MGVIAIVAVIVGLVAIYFITKKPEVEAIPPTEGGKPPPCGSYGDVDEDGYVTIKDAMLIEQYINGEKELTVEQYHKADVDGDGFITDTDAKLIADYVVGKIDTFPVCGVPVEPIVIPIPVAPSTPLVIPPTILEEGVHVHAIRAQQVGEGIHAWTYWYHHGKGYEGRNYVYFCYSKLGRFVGENFYEFRRGGVFTSKPPRDIPPDGRLEIVYGFCSQAEIDKIIGLGEPHGPASIRTIVRIADKDSGATVASVSGHERDIVSI